jgi:hypothetical protein
VPRLPVTHPLCDDADMDDAAYAELRALQARAYGPGDGLATDAAARRRLGELEARARADRARPPVVHAVPDPPPRTTPTAPPPLPTVPAAVAAASTSTRLAETPIDPDARRRRMLTAITWAGSLAMVATLAVGVTAAATGRTAWTGGSVVPGTNITHVATLDLDPDREWSEAMDVRPRDARVFEQFSGLIPVVGSLPVGDGVQLCIQLIPASAWEAESGEGRSVSRAGSCGIEPFRPGVGLIVGAADPAALRERFPAGARLQFVVGDGVVDVYAADAPVEQAAG